MTIAFDPEATSYDEWYSTKLGAFIDHIQTTTAFDLLAPKKGMRILDVGCGTGNYSLKLNRLGCEVVGVDISGKMLKVFRNKLNKEKADIELHQLIANELPFEDDSFDAVISVTAAEFMSDLSAVVDEMFRVVKKQGSIVIGTLHKKSAWGELYESDFFKTETVFKHASLLDKKTLGNLHPDQLLKFKESLFFPPNTDENSLNPSIENKFKEENNGGFLCALWKK